MPKTQPYLKLLLLAVTFSISTMAFGQHSKEYFIVHDDTTGTQKFGFVFTTAKGDTVTRLDTARYYICFSNTFQYFAVVGIKHKRGWWAIDKNEKTLFQVYNVGDEPSPDELREGMIRTVDDSGKIGFANYRGEIVIKPQFEAVSGFYKDKAIIGRDCKKVLWCCGGEGGDKHYSIECKQCGYINKKGQIQKIGKQTFEEVEKEIGWKEIEE